LRKLWEEVLTEHLLDEVMTRNGKFQYMISFMGICPMPAFVKDRRGRMIYMNHKAESHWHVLVKDVRGQTAAEILHLNETDARQMERQTKKVIGGTEPVVFMETLGNSNKTVRSSVLMFPFVDDDGDRLVGAFVLPYNSWP
jgi:hypothetical protein